MGGAAARRGGKDEARLEAAHEPLVDEAIVPNGGADVLEVLVDDAHFLLVDCTGRAEGQ